MVQPAGFHEGERAVQQRAGVASDAARLSGMLALPHLDGGARLLLADQEFAVLAARDAAGVFWTSPLRAGKGFLDAHGQTLDVSALPAATDPLAGLPPAQPVGLIAIDFARRRRVRVNGTVAAVDPAGFSVDVLQAYGNCPQYIHRRNLALTEVPSSSTTRSSTLTWPQRQLIDGADTFFLGTTHPTRGNDASHRGGSAGFVRSTAHELRWPDYPGNNMFNSLGNIAVDPTASLLFLNFSSGETLQLSGTAVVEWNAAGPTGRQVRFTVGRVVHTAG